MEWTGKWVQGQKMAMYQMVVVDLRLLPHHCDSMKTCMSMSMASPLIMCYCNIIPDPFPFCTKGVIWGGSKMQI